MACEIENAGGAFLFRDFDAFRAQPIRKEGVAAAGIDDHVRAHFFDRAVVLDAQAFDQKRSAFAPRKKSAHAGIGDETNARQPRRIAAHDELERRAAAEEERHVLVFRLGRVTIAQRRRQSVFKAEDTRAGREKLFHQMRDSARG